MHTKSFLLGAALSLFAAIPNTLPAGQFFQDFSGSSIGATSFSDGSQLFSTTPSVAQVVNSPYKELQLTTNGISSVRSAYELPDLDSNTPVYAFSAKWNMPVFANFGGSPPPADGFSFNFGQLSSVNLTNGTAESGYGVGLSFDVQTYSGNNPGFYIRVGTNIIASSSYTPQTEWGSNNGARHFFEVDWNYYTGVTVRMDGTNTIFSNVIITNFFPQGGDRFVFAARCGSFNELISVDNIAIVTGGNLVPLPASAPYFSTPDAILSPSNAFNGNLTDYWQGLALPTVFGATFLPSNAVAAYVLTSSSDGNRATDPSVWILQGSQNGGGSWINCGTGGGYFQNDIESHCYLANNSAAFGAYALNIVANNGSGATAAAELQLYALSKVAAPYATWIQTSATNAPWSGVAISADGQKLAATTADRLPDGGRIYLSIDGGKTWALSTAPTNNEWYGVASSADGTKLIASQWYNDGHVYLSTNSGATWTLDSSYPSGAGGTVASSADGTKLAVAQPTWGVYTSTNSGATWTFTASGLPTGGSGNWTAIASSADGTRLFVAAGPFGDVYYSTNSGATWIQTVATGNNWTSLTCSSNGMRVTAIALNGLSPGFQYVSTDGGASWVYAGTSPWWSYTSSLDGNSSLATDKSHLFTLSPFNGNTPPATSLGVNPSGNYPTLSWPTANGGNFALQQSSSLSAPNWTNVFWPVVISNTNYQVTPPSPGASGFFRLKNAVK